RRAATWARCYQVSSLGAVPPGDLVVWLLWSFLACDVAAPPAPTLAPATLVAPEPAPAPRPPALDGSDLPEPTEPRYAASHVLVAWVGARGAGPRVTRGRDEALALA